MWTRPRRPVAMGKSWGTAFTTLQDALAALNPGGCLRNIWMAEGTYYPTTGGDTSAHFELPTLAAIYGGFVSGQTDPALRDCARIPTILSGDIGTPLDSSDNSAGRCRY